MSCDPVKMPDDHAHAMDDEPSPRPWQCTFCGADNTPEHCCGAADFLDDPFDQPRCRVDGEPGYCVCGCADCNPSTCISCGEDL